MRRASPVLLLQTIEAFYSLVYKFIIDFSVILWYTDLVLQVRRRLAAGLVDDFGDGWALLLEENR